MQAAEPATENVPLGHVMQADALEEPDSAENVPAGHCMQAFKLFCPVEALHVPAGHLLHWDWPSALAKVPALQARQSLIDLEPAGDDVPDLHGVQGTYPVLDQVPPGHSFAHLSSESEPADEDCPSGHFLHSLIEVLPVLGLNVL